MRIDFNTSLNSANTPVKNDQKVTVEDAKDAWDYNTVVLEVVRRTLNVYFFCKSLKSLILLSLWIRDFWDYTRYLVFWLYFGCRFAMEAYADKLYSADNNGFIQVAHW